MMASDLVWASIDGPHGVRAVTLPAERWGALALKDHHRGEFWCTTEAGGCGGRLIANAGEIRRPYFRHHAGAPCQYLSRPDSAGPAYEHLQYQRHFQRWLVDQGLNATLEKVLGADGRTDLHVHVERVSHSLEIQLSPMPTQAWHEREGRYRRHVHHVTWFYGPGAESASAMEVSRSGVAFDLRPGPEIGVRDVDNTRHWVPLKDCRLMPDGLQVPGLAEARALQDQRQKEQMAKATAAREALALAEVEREQRREAQERANREYFERQAAQRDALEKQRRARVQQLRLDAQEDEDDPYGVAPWEQRFPESRAWTPGIGWSWLEHLPAEARRPARALAYTTQVLSFAATEHSALPELTDPELRDRLFALLESLGVISRQAFPTFVRWERATRVQPE